MRRAFFFARWARPNTAAGLRAPRSAGACSAAHRSALAFFFRTLPRVSARAAPRSQTALFPDAFGLAATRDERLDWHDFLGSKQRAGVLKPTARKKRGEGAREGEGRKKEACALGPLRAEQCDATPHPERKAREISPRRASERAKEADQGGSPNSAQPPQTGKPASRQAKKSRKKTATRMIEAKPSRGGLPNSLASVRHESQMRQASVFFRRRETNWNDRSILAGKAHDQ